MSISTYIELKEKINKYSPHELLTSLSFEEAISTAYNMLYNDEWDESLQEYAANLLEELRKKYPREWNTNWKYDTLLENAYNIIFKHDDRYEAYKRAFDKVHPVPPELLVAIAECCIAPGKPPITREEAISLIKQAMQQTLYIEGVELLIGIYKSLGDTKEQRQWEDILESIKEHGEHLPSLNPAVG